MPPDNKAAWLIAPGIKPLEVKQADYTAPGPNQIVVRNAAVAVSQIDWAKQIVGDKKWEWIPHPCILGEDIAGEVVEVGDEVTRFKIGDRVIAHALGFYAYVNRPAESAFQLYTIAREQMTSPIPDSMSFEQACVIPMSCSAASCALYQKHLLALDYPTFPAAASNGQVILITSGSSSVGSNAIQLARASGYEVFTTCSSRSFPYVERLGASRAFDYNSPTLEIEIVTALKGRRVAGAFAIGPGSVELSIRVLGQLGDECRKVIAKASFPWPKHDPKDDTEYWAYMEWVDTWYELIREMEKKVGVETKFVEGAELGRNEVSRAVYEDFLPNALAGGAYIAAPEPQVVGHGLDHIQEALDTLKQGVNTKKIVVSL